MSESFETIEDAFLALADPGNPGWADAFRTLTDNPDTAALMLDTFRDTLEQMGVKPSSANPTTGEPEYSFADVAGAMGVPETGLESAVQESQVESNPG